MTPRSLPQGCAGPGRDTGTATPDPAARPHEKGRRMRRPPWVDAADQALRRRTSATPPSASRLSARLAGSGTAEAASFTT